MTTTDSVTSAELAPVDEPLFSQDEQAALAGFLAGYSGLTRDAYTLDLRMYTAWCVQRGLHLFTARRADIECLGHDMETAGRARRSPVGCAQSLGSTATPSRKTSSNTPQPPTCGDPAWTTNRTRSG